MRVKTGIFNNIDAKLNKARGQKKITLKKKGTE